MPLIEFEMTDRVRRHLAAVRLMFHMVFPDDANLREAADITYRTILADWYSAAFSGQPKADQALVVQQIEYKLHLELPRAVADPTAWMRNRLFDEFLRPAGGTHEGAFALTNSPSSEYLAGEWARRWWPIFYTGKILALIGSIDQHHRATGASVNKAIHILCQTDGEDKAYLAFFHDCGFPQVYDSSLNKAWLTDLVVDDAVGCERLSVNLSTG